MLAQTDGVAGLRARLELVRDTSELLQLERSHRTEEAVDDQLAAGFAALQLWEVTGERSHAERSRHYFDRAADRDPRNPWAHYGHALSFAPDIGRGPGFIATDDAIGRALGVNAISRARRALERAVALDPALPGAAELLARYASSTWDGDALKLARTSLGTAASDPNAGTPVLLALARTAREQGDFEGAAAAAELAVGRNDASLAEAHLELARSLASLDGRLAEAGAAYFAALGEADERLLTRLWDDVAYVAQDADQEQWEDAATTAVRRDALRRFWEVHGALAGRTGAERAAEHYARLDFAWLHHRRYGELGAPPLNAYRWKKIDARFTDPGVIYIRHGPPDHSWLSPGRDYLVWYYTDERGGPLSYHFRRYEDQPGWSKDLILIRTLPCLEPQVALYDPRLRPLTYGCNAMRVQAISATVRGDVARALRTENGAPRFAREIRFHYDLYTFRGEDGGTDVVAGVGVPFAQLPLDDPPLHFSLFVVDTARYRVARTSASLPAPPRPADSLALLEVNLQLTAPPAPGAAYRIAIRDRDGEAGMTYGGPLHVRDYRGPGLNASDVVLAAPGSAGSFRRGGQRLALAPTQVFPGGRFRVYYELYNLPAGEAYRTELRVERRGRGWPARLFGGGDPVGLRFDEVAPEAGGETLPQLREVTAPLAPGEYVLHLRVRTARGEVERERRFTVPER